MRFGAKDSYALTKSFVVRNRIFSQIPLNPVLYNFNHVVKNANFL